MSNLLYCNWHTKIPAFTITIDFEFEVVRFLNLTDTHFIKLRAPGHASHLLYVVNICRDVIHSDNIFTFHPPPHTHRNASILYYNSTRKSLRMIIFR